MFKKSNILFLNNTTPLHVGAGEGVGGVDSPIQREGHTKFPKIEASGIKGAQKEAYRRNSKTIQINGENIKVNGPKEKTHHYVHLVFGPEEGDAHSSAIGFSDAKLLLFPVPSLQGTFAWVTCPHVLSELMLNLQRVFPGKEYEWQNFKELCGQLEEGFAYVGKDSNIPLKNNKEMLFLQAYPFSCPQKLKALAPTIQYKKAGIPQTVSIAEWLVSTGMLPSNYFQEKLSKDLVILNDKDFADFVEMDTEVIDRIRINPETGVVQDGALFTEEYLPAQSVLYSVVSFAPVFMNQEKLEKELLKTASDIESFYSQGLPDYWQIGGNATLGKGLTYFKLLEL